jgi:hypothetical protein
MQQVAGRHRGDDQTGRRDRLLRRHDLRIVTVSGGYWSLSCLAIDNYLGTVPGSDDPQAEPARLTRT